MAVMALLRAMDKRNRLMDIPISEIVTNPHQPRKVFTKESIEELAASISQYGLIQPITVRLGEYSKYELIAGERRMRACMMLGYKRISAIVIEVSNCDSAALALIENLQRENLNYIEEAEGYNNLIVDFGLTQDELAKRVGKSQATIANKLRLLRLSPAVKKLLREKGLTERHARALLRLSSEEEQLQVLQMICEQSLNVKQTDELIDSMRLHQICQQQPDQEEMEETQQEQPISEEAPEKTPDEMPNGKPIRIFKDVRIFVNTIKQALEMMKQSGIQAVSEKTENEDYIEYTIRIPKAN